MHVQSISLEAASENYSTNCSNVLDVFNRFVFTHTGVSGRCNTGCMFNIYTLKYLIAFLPKELNSQQAHTLITEILHCKGRRHFLSIKQIFQQVNMSKNQKYNGKLVHYLENQYKNIFKKNINYCLLALVYFIYRATYRFTQKLFQSINLPLKLRKEAWIKYLHMLAWFYNYKEYSGMFPVFRNYFAF